MLELKDLAAAQASTLACIVWLKRQRQCAIRVTPRNSWILIDHIASIQLHSRTHDAHFSYREIAAYTNELRHQLANATSPTHSHTHTDWRPPTRLSKTKRPAYHDHFQAADDSLHRGQRRGGRHTNTLNKPR